MTTSRKKPINRLSEFFSDCKQHISARLLLPVFQCRQVTLSYANAARKFGLRHIKSTQFSNSSPERS